MKRVKYLILVSGSDVFGAFFPSEKKKALEYLKSLKKKNKLIKLCEVINLNKFYQSLRSRK